MIEGRVAPSMQRYPLRMLTSSSISGWARRLIPETGVNLLPAGVAKRAARTKLASITTDSVMEKEAPMQMRGPAPNGMYW